MTEPYAATSGSPIPGGVPPTTPSGVRRRTHPVTPIVTAGRIAPFVLVAMFAWGPDGGAAALLAGVAFAAVLALAVAGYSYLAWQRLTFWFDADGDFRVDQGVLTRKETRLQLSRLQAVDVVQPLIARLFGMAEVRIEAAGAGESRATLTYLTLTDAQALRSEVLARAAGLHESTQEAPEDVVHVVPTPVLLKGLLLRGATFALLAFSVLLVVIAVLTEGPGGLVLLLFTGGVPLVAVFNEFTKNFDFTVAMSPDGLRIRSGLFQRTAQTVPPGRVHALEIVEPWLWRRFGWVRVKVSLASGGGDSDAEVAGVLLPVGTRAEAAAIIDRLMPGAFPTDVQWLGVPEGASYRAPFQHHRLAVAFAPGAFMTRGGWMTWTTAWVPDVRTQSVRVTQGPWQRKLGLASMHVDTVPGPVGVVALHRAAGDARYLADRQAQRAADARRLDTSMRWMRPRAVSSDEGADSPAVPPQPPAAGD